MMVWANGGPVPRAEWDIKRFAAWKGVSSFFHATVYGRAVAALVFVALVMSKLGPVQLLIFAAVDGAAAIWTYLAIKQERAA